MLWFVSLTKKKIFIHCYWLSKRLLTCIMKRTWLQSFERWLKNTIFEIIWIISSWIMSRTTIRYWSSYRTNCERFMIFITIQFNIVFDAWITSSIFLSKFFYSMIILTTRKYRMFQKILMRKSWTNTKNSNHRTNYCQMYEV